ncbi:MAG: c-type cytochrome [Panacagrimonas sp.]
MKPQIAAALVALLLGTSAQAAGDAAAGKVLVSELCSGCHAADKNGVGPMHRGVFGNKAGSRPGYTYSQALVRTGVVWNETTLRMWLADPNAFLAGNKMSVQLLETGQEYADVIAYLKTLGADASK